MNAIAPITSEITMSSREIAERTGKRHANVLADIRHVLATLDLAELKFQSSYKDASGKSNVEYRLPEDLVITLISGYSIPLRHKIILRLRELEAEKASNTVALPDFTDAAEAARAWALEFEERQRAEALVKEMLPQAEIGTLAVSHKRKVINIARQMPGVNSMQVLRDLRSQFATRLLRRSA